MLVHRRRQLGVFWRPPDLHKSVGIPRRLGSCFQLVGRADWFTAKLEVAGKVTELRQTTIGVLSPNWERATRSSHLPRERAIAFPGPDGNLQLGFPFTAICSHRLLSLWDGLFLRPRVGM